MAAEASKKGMNSPSELGKGFQLPLRRVFYLRGLLDR